MSHADEDLIEGMTSRERVLAASRRIYIFDWVSDFFIGDSVRKARIFALSFVGSGFKTLAIMLLLVFWNIFWVILETIFDYISNFVQEEEHALSS